ncbi:MAG: uridine kinase [Limisphaerales bacterium]
MADALPFWKKRAPVIIGITGGSGSGKTWLADELQKRFNKESCLISLDAFYKDRTHLPPARREKINFDHPRAINWDAVETLLEDSLAGLQSKIPEYDFTNHSSLNPKIFTPRPLIFFEGLWLLRRASVRKHFKLSIFLECSADLRLQRRLQRDQRERGRTIDSIREQFNRCVEPMHQRFVQGQKRWADIVLAKPLTKGDVDDLTTKINERFSENNL